jgi:hypothetical protein
MRLLGMPSALFLGSIAAVLAVAGLVIMLFWTPWGGILLVGAVLAWWLNAMVRRRRQAVLKKLLAQEPVYKRLLDDYPDATLVLSINGKST